VAYFFYYLESNQENFLKKKIVRSKTPMGRRSLNSFFVLSLVSLSTTAALWQESRNCLTYCADHINCCEDKTLPQSNTPDEHNPPIIYASEGRYGKRSAEHTATQNPVFDPKNPVLDPKNPVFDHQEPHQNEDASALDDNEVKQSTRTKRSVDNVVPGKEDEQFYRYYNVGKRSSPHVSGFDRSKDADMMMRLGKRSVDNFNHMSDFHKRQTASMMRMGKRSVPDTDNQESADRIYRLLMNKRQTSSMMRMGKRSAFNGDMMRMGKRESAFYDDARFGKRVPGDMMRMGKRESAFYDDARFGKRVPGDMMRMGKRESAFYDDERFGKRGKYQSKFSARFGKRVPGDMMRMGKRYLDDDVRFGKREAFNGDMMRMGKRESAFYDDARFGKRVPGDMMRMGKRESAFYDDARFGKRVPGDMMRMGKRDFSDDMRFGKRDFSSFNGDMMRMGKRSAFNDDMRFGKRDYPEITEDMLRNSRDPWLIMDDEGFNTINKRSSSIWKKNQDADLMRMGKRSAFNDDMMRMGKRQNLLDSYMRLSFPSNN